MAAVSLALLSGPAARAQEAPADRAGAVSTADSARAAAPPDSARAPSAAADSAAAARGRAYEAARDTTLRKVKPFFVMARSAVVPGWGQVYNRQPLKAVLVVAGEGFLTYKIFRELKLQNDAIDRQDLTFALGDSAGYHAALDDEEFHKNRKIDWIWWTAAAHLLQMADAYVDAHFVNFDAEFGPDDRGGARAAARLRLALQVNF